MTERASPARKSRGRGDRQALCQSDTIAAQSCLAAALPSQSGLRPPAPPKGEPLAEWKTLNWEGKLCGLPKPPLGRGGGSASALTERLSPAAAHGQASLRTTSQSASQTAPLVGEPLAKPFTLQGLPKPLPLGEVSPKVTERASPARKRRRAAIGRLFVRAIRSLYQSCLAAALPSQALRASSPKGRAFGARGRRR